MFETWILASIPQLAMVALGATGIYVATIIFTRLTGLRSFSKMSSFDFAMTVAIGSIIATTLVAENPPLLQGVVGLGTVYLLQKIVSALRRFAWVNKLVDNTPVLLMDRHQVYHDNLKRTGVTPADLRSKLREANVLERSQVRAVVFETTGDLAVLHSDKNDARLEAWLLEGVGDSEKANLDEAPAGASTP